MASAPRTQAAEHTADCPHCHRGHLRQVDDSESLRSGIRLLMCDRLECAQVVMMPIRRVDPARLRPVAARAAEVVH